MTAALTMPPSICPNTSETTRLAQRIKAKDKVVAPASICFVAKFLNCGLLTSGRSMRCCTAGAVKRMMLMSEKINVAMKTHFSAVTICRKPELNGKVIKNAVSSCDPGNRIRSSFRISVRSPSSCAPTGSAGGTASGGREAIRSRRMVGCFFCEVGTQLVCFDTLLRLTIGSAAARSFLSSC